MRPQVGPGRRAGTGFSRRRCGAACAWGRGGEEAGAAACSGNVPGGRRGRADGPRRGARGPPAGVARFGVPVRVRGGRSTSWAGRRAASRPPAAGWAAARGARSGGGIGREWPCRSAGPRRRPDVPCSKGIGTLWALPRRLLTLGCVTCSGGEVRESAAGWRRVCLLSRGTSRSARRAILFNALSRSKGNPGAPLTPRRSHATRDVVGDLAMIEARVTPRMHGPGGGDTSRRLWRRVCGLRCALRRTNAAGVAKEPAWSGSLRGGPMSSWAPPEPGPRVWTNGRFRNVGCAVQPSSDKKREENPGGHVLPRL